MATRNLLTLAVITIIFIAAIPEHHVSASSASTSNNNNNNQRHLEPPVHRGLHETLHIFPSRIGSTEQHVLALSPTHVQKRAVNNLAMFPRVGRTPNLQAFPRLGRVPTLAAFPRVGRRGPNSEMDSWCSDCSQLEFLRQLARRELVLPQRAGRAEKTFSYMVPRPRIGKRLRPQFELAAGNKRQIQGLAAFPRVGRAGGGVEQIEDEEDPKWFAEPAKREGLQGGDSKLWFGPRLGRRKRDLQDQVVPADTLFPVYHLIEAPLLDVTDRDSEESTLQDVLSSQNSW